MSDSNNLYIPYDDSVETIADDEQATFHEIAATMRRISVIMNDRYRHAVRSVHAKSHGLLKGGLKVHDNLPEPLRQGLFSEPRSYPVIIRFSTVPGDILADSISTPRGMALKVVGVEEMEMLPEHIGEVTQDFVCVNAKSFPAPDAKTFLKQQQFIEKNANDPEFFKQIVSTVARGTNALLGAVGAQSAALAQLGHPETHILGETYGTTAALRYGRYIAKIIIRPISENLKALTGKHVDVSKFSGLKDAIVEFFQTETAVWEVAAQLCRDLQKMPVEDPSVEWPEDLSPYLPVATLTVSPQEAYSAARRVYVDEVLSFNPFHCLAAHRPLGNIMRARRQSYQMSSKFRHEMNDRKMIEPRRIEELPD